jgi:hypothetical protein
MKEATDCSLFVGDSDEVVLSVSGPDGTAWENVGSSHSDSGQLQSAIRVALDRLRRADWEIPDLLASLAREKCKSFPSFIQGLATRISSADRY